jgi:uncharacterized protein YqeY
MGSHLDKITTDMKAAMKSGDKSRLEVLRMLISDLKKKAIDTQVDALKDDEEVAMAANRAEIADREQKEIEIITAYLPQQMSAAEVAVKVKALAAEIGYAGGKDTGRFMKEWMARFKGVADGKLVQEALKTLPG